MSRGLASAWHPLGQADATSPNPFVAKGLELIRIGTLSTFYMIPRPHPPQALRRIHRVKGQYVSDRATEGNGTGPPPRWVPVPTTVCQTRPREAARRDRGPRGVDGVGPSAADSLPGSPGSAM